MNARIRREALKAAAKVALSIGAVGSIALTGCSAAPRDSEETTSASSSEGALRRKHSLPRDTDTSCPTECEAALDALPPASSVDDAGTIRLDSLPHTSDVVACCNTLLTEYEARWNDPNATDDDSADATDGGATAAPKHIMTKHKLACCAATADDPQHWWQNSAHQGACTPWGPPMPPSMEAQKDVIGGWGMVA